jgi:hypothetical protein
MATGSCVRALSVLNKDDLIVVGGAGGVIGGALVRYFHDQGFTRVRAIDKKPPPEVVPAFTRCRVPVPGPER